MNYFIIFVTLNNQINQTRTTRLELNTMTTHNKQTNNNYIYPLFLILRPLKDNFRISPYTLTTLNL
jgi:hypothetical protein